MWLVNWKQPLMAGIILFLEMTVTASFLENEHQKATPARQPRSYDLHRSSKDRTSENSVKMQAANRNTIFITQNSTVVAAQIKGTAKLPCVVKKFGNAVVSWIRKQDAPALLTVGPTTYSADDRIMVEHLRHLQNWILVIKHVQTSDAGLYECQVSTHPPTSIFIDLRVTEALAEIVGAPDLHIRAGSQLKIVCKLRHSTEAPSYVFWYRDRHMINYDEGVSVIEERASSILLLEDADSGHSGNYTCFPSNAIPAHVNVHVLNATEEEYPAAMVHANSGTTIHKNILVVLVFIVIIPECYSLER